MIEKRLSFEGKVVVVTGAGGGLGRCYASEFARRGAKVVVNDLGGSASGDGKSASAADEVVEAIKSAGGEAVASYDSVENGEAIIQTAIDTYGRVDVLINNAGILRDSSFKKMTDEDWELVYRVHCFGAYKVTKAAWTHMVEQKYGRIINTTSAAGLYGHFGQANYSTAKMGLLGLTKTLAIEGAKYNIKANAIAPAAGSRLTEGLFPSEVVDALKPEFITPLVVRLCAEESTENGSVFELGAGWMAKMRWQRSAGVGFDPQEAISAEDVAQRWDEICDFSKYDNPVSASDSSIPMLKNVGIKY